MKTSHLFQGRNVKRSRGKKIVFMKLKELGQKARKSRKENVEFMKFSKENVNLMKFSVNFMKFSGENVNFMKFVNFMKNIILLNYLLYPRRSELAAR